MSLTIITGPMFSGKCLHEDTLVVMADEKVLPIKELKVGDTLLNGNSVTFISDTKLCSRGIKYLNLKKEFTICTPNHLHIPRPNSVPRMLEAGDTLEGFLLNDGSWLPMLSLIESHDEEFPYRELSVSGNNMITLEDGHQTHNTTSLIAAIRRETYRNTKPLIVKYDSDKRFTADAGSIITHSGIHYNQVDMIFASTLADAAETVKNYDVIGVDEVQFYQDIELLYQWMMAGKSIYTCGLLSDFQGKPFGRVAEIIAMATKHVSLTAICQICHDRDAMFNHRLLATDESLISIGGIDEYMVCCQICIRRINHPLNKSMGYITKDASS